MVKYYIQKSKTEDYYILFKDVSIGNGCCIGAVFKGKRKECYNRMKILKK